jgi:hypothetical protein
MFSQGFIHTLSGVRDTREPLATVLQALRLEAQRRERGVTIRHNEITLKTGRFFDRAQSRWLRRHQGNRKLPIV